MIIDRLKCSVFVIIKCGTPKRYIDTYNKVLLVFCNLVNKCHTHYSAVTLINLANISLSGFYLWK